MKGRYDYPKEKLLAYGFVEREGTFFLTTDFAGGRFLALVTLREGCLQLHLFDKELREEFFVHKAKKDGPFLTPLLEEEQSLLEDIRKNCAVYRYETEQANRIYANFPFLFSTSFEHLWEKEPGFAVLRNERGHWFALLMEIDGRRIRLPQERVVLLNVRCRDVDPFMTLGVLPAYHMNKRTWVSLRVDDTLSDDFLQQKTRESLRLSLAKD